MATKKTLTAASVERIKPPQTGQRDTFDAAMPGLALRVSYGGSKTFVLFYRLHGRQRRMTLGRYPGLSLSDARTKARDALQAVERGEDPAQERKEAKARRPDTWENVAEDFIEKYAKRQNRSWKVAQSIFENHVTPHWRGRDFKTIKRRDVLDLLDTLIDAGLTTQANRVLAHTRKLFNWALEREIIDASPVAGVKPPEKEKQRDRVLDDDELRTLWGAFNGMGYPFGPMFKLLLLTGQRRSEVAEMRWRDIDLDKAVWTLPATSTKAGRAHEVPLSPQAVEILRLLPRFTGKDAGDFVFSTQNGKTPVSGYSKAKLRCAADLNKRLAKDGKEPMADWRLHDLRRTAATNIAKLGFPVDVVGKVLNHAPRGVTSVYDRHSYMPQKKAALDAWAKRLDAVVSGKPASNVIELAEAR